MKIKKVLRDSQERKRLLSLTDSLKIGISKLYLCMLTDGN